MDNELLLKYKETEGLDISIESLDQEIDQSWKDYTKGMESLTDSMEEFDKIEDIVDELIEIGTPTEKESMEAYSQIKLSMEALGLDPEAEGLKYDDFVGEVSMEGLGTWLAKTSEKIAKFASGLTKRIKKFKARHLTLLGLRSKIARNALERARSLVSESPQSDVIELGVEVAKLTTDNQKPTDCKTIESELIKMTNQMNTLYTDWVYEYEKDIDTIRKIFLEASPFKMVTAFEEVIAILDDMGFKEIIEKMGVGENVQRGKGYITAKHLIGHRCIVARQGVYEDRPVNDGEFDSMLKIGRAAVRSSLYFRTVPYDGVRPMHAVIKAPTKSELISMLEANLNNVDNALEYITRLTNRDFAMQLLLDFANWRFTKNKLSWAKLLKIGKKDLTRREYNQMIRFIRRLGRVSVSWYYHPGNDMLRHTGQVSRAVNVLANKCIKNLS